MVSNLKVGDIVVVDDVTGYEKRCSVGDIGLVVDVEGGEKPLVYVRFKWCANDIAIMFSHRFTKLGEAEVTNA
jgi:hypothetical protein